MKKALVLFLATVFAVLMTACWPGSSVDDMNITSLEGAGSRTFHIRIYKDGATAPNGSDIVGEEAKMFGEAGECILPGGIEAVLTAVNANRPEDVPEVKMIEEDDYYDLHYTIEFTSIEDFNAQCKAIAGENWTEDHKEATWTVTPKGKGHEVKYTEDPQLFAAVNLWQAEAVYNSPDAFDNEYAYLKADVDEADDLIQNDGVSITINGKLTEIKSKPVSVDATGTFGDTTEEVSSVVPDTSSDAPPVSSQGKSSDNPKTGDKSFAVPAAVLFAGALAGCLVIIKKREIA